MTGFATLAGSCLCVALVAAMAAYPSAAQSPGDKASKPASTSGSEQTRGDSKAAIDPLVQAARAKSAKLTKAQRDANQQVFANASTLFQRGDFASARRGFELVLGVDPADAAAHYYLAEALIRLNDPAAAKEHYQMAVALSPGSIEGLQAATALEKVDVQQPQRAACGSNPAQVQDRGGGVLWQCSSGLEWTQSDNGSDIGWNDARRWCDMKGGEWHLPTADELVSLVDKSARVQCGRSTCIVSPSFRLTEHWFWSSDTIVTKGSPSGASLVFLDSGLGLPGPFDYTEHIRALCVRQSGSKGGLQPAPAPAQVERQQREPAPCESNPTLLEDRGGGVLKQCSGLEWTQADNGSDINWNDARRWCGVKGGGWRLPTQRELLSLFDLKQTASFRLTDEWFWSSDQERSSDVWAVLLKEGEFELLRIGNTDYLRALCVRQSAPTQTKVSGPEQERAACASNPSRVDDRGNGILRQCSGLEWTQADNGSDINWNDARRWCDTKGGGWRLPTVEEIASLLDERAPRVQCGKFTCSVSPSFRVTSMWLWSSDTNSSVETWLVAADNGYKVAAYTAYSENVRALCARRP